MKPGSTACIVVMAALTASHLMHFDFKGEAKTKINQQSMSSAFVNSSGVDAGVIKFEHDKVTYEVNQIKGISAKWLGSCSTLDGQGIVRYHSDFLLAQPTIEGKVVTLPAPTAQSVTVAKFDRKDIEQKCWWGHAMGDGNVQTLNAKLQKSLCDMGANHANDQAIRKAAGESAAALIKAAGIETAGLQIKFREVAPTPPTECT
jgi:hypothetical protein